MRIAFVNPPLQDGKAVEAEDCCWGKRSRVLPAMLLACASESQLVGDEVAFIDLSIDDADVLHEFKPDLVVHALAWQYHRETNEAMAAACAGVPRIVLAIPAGYADYYEALHPGPLAVLADEPECLFAGEVSSFDELSPIDYALVPRYYWRYYAAAVYQVTRGCPYRCPFCVWGGSTVTGRKFRMRPAKQVAANLRQLRELATEATGKPLPLYLLSAQLTTSPRWLRQFHAEMRGDPYPFQSNVNLGEVTRGKLRLLREAGMRRCSAGLEALTDETLWMLGKPYTFDRALRSILALDRSGITYRLHVRTGYGETADDVKEAIINLRRMKYAGVERVGIDIAPIVHYEGTAIREQARYPLVPHPGYEVECLIMADAPDWGGFVAVLREYGWLTSVGLTK